MLSGRADYYLRLRVLFQGSAMATHSSHPSHDIDYEAMWEVLRMSAPLVAFGGLRALVDYFTLRLALLSFTAKARAMRVNWPHICNVPSLASRNSSRSRTSAAADTVLT